MNVYEKRSCGKGAKRCSWSCAGNCIITFTTRSVLYKKKQQFNCTSLIIIHPRCLFLISAPSPSPSPSSSSLSSLVVRNICYVHGFFQSDFSEQCDLLHPISISIPYFRKVIQQLLTYSSSSSCHFCPSLYISFSNVL